MDLDFDDTMVRALRRYARCVASVLGLGDDRWGLRVERPVGVRVALGGRVASYPDRDAALVWDERHGWSIVVEGDGGRASGGGCDVDGGRVPDGGRDLVVARLGGLAVPRPDAVAEWVAGLVHRSVGADEPRRPGEYALADR
ncbi:DUF6292 family protein [Saccharothrix syringae]|uniref:DUF6292 domain-containing protein n=1 Tax=Saccharothrix syringae TaxID=103733 RepID=A0A5Q0H4Y5_SACSY|nr:DUF6292 family protein [Saccharothrix syringae]QFZ20994.1 hypothetical protein EKG83_29640 [Saccharothrix syringae]